MSAVQQVTVLVTGVGGASLGEQCLKALRLARTPYRIVAADVKRASVGLAGADVPCVVPLASEDGYVDELLRLCDEHAVAALIPTSEAELRVVSAARGRFEERDVFLPINRHELIAAGDDKSLGLDAITAAGCRTPRHLRAGSAAETTDWELFPCVIKPAVGGSGSANVFIAQSRAELETLTGYLLAVTTEVIVEEYVGTVDSEFTVAVLHDMEGELIHSIAIRRALLGGISNRIKVPNRTGRADLGEVLAISSGISQGRIGDFPQVRQACERLAEGLDSRGPLNIQCRWHEDELVVFEINPRFSGTSALRALAGFNEPDLLIRMQVLGEAIERGFAHAYGTVVRGLSEVFFPDE
ncbi:MAG: ATP-grasp domain-containing protein [Acidobacteriota bacterium]|jgi:carbamoyl-phosphate synthase large subunit